MHYDPAKATDIAAAAIAYYARHPVHLSFKPIRPTHIGIYTDASHSRLTYRAHAGAWVQLQSSGNAELRHNPVAWGSEKLTKMYDSVFSSEAKAAELGIKAMLKVKDLITSIYGPLDLVLFSDNKALVTTVNKDTEPHPFASSSIDYLRQLKDDLNMEVKWVPTAENLADILTKPSRA